ncbi:hypothetical protein IMSAG049_00699 [Clostridiales bacterium]|nr:hypothetical protein IMSAG049_00699 [Clostridiales bacterium]
MEEKRQISEKLLEAWLNISSTVWNRRVVSTMTFNEIYVCNLLKNQSEKPMTATDLCEKTRLFKSQMNKVLNSLEEKELIRRVRSIDDKRFVFIEITEKGLEQYSKEHEAIMLMIDTLVDRIGESRAEETAEAVNDISEQLKNLLVY